MESITSASKRQGSILSGLATQTRVIRALMLRVLQQRYGRNNIGYLWVVGEPMMLATVITLIHAAVTPHEGNGVSPFTFMLTGYGIYIIFRNSFNRSEGLLHSTETLLYHRMVTPFDIVVANLAVETIGCMSAILFMQTIGIIAGVSELPFRPLYLLGAIALFAWFTLGASLVISAYGYVSPIISRLAHPMSYFALPVSGAFVSMSFLPLWARPLLTWNPMTSIFEMARYGQFMTASKLYFFPSYVISVNLLLTYWGLIAIRRVREKIHVP